MAAPSAAQARRQTTIRPPDPNDYDWLLSGYQGWTANPIWCGAANNDTMPGAALVVFNLIPVPNRITVAGVAVNISQAGAGAQSNCQVGVYTVRPFGTDAPCVLHLAGYSADTSADWGSLGPKSHPLVGGPVEIHPPLCYAGFQIGVQSNIKLSAFSNQNSGHMNLGNAGPVILGTNPATMGGSSHRTFWVTGGAATTLQALGDVGVTAASGAATVAGGRPAWLALT